MILRPIAQRCWDEIKMGEELPAVELPITYAHCVGLVSATRDFFPGHHDPEYARAQGQPNIYLNTGFFHGFLDRVALEWAGPGWFLRRRKLIMTMSVYPGDVMRSESHVVSKAIDDGGMRTVELALAVYVGSRRCLSGEITLAVPQRATSSEAGGI